MKQGNSSERASAENTNVPHEHIASTSDDGQEVEAVLEAASEELAEEAVSGSGHFIASLKPAESKRYKYVAYTRDQWQKVEAVLEAASEELAEEALWESGYLVATLKPAESKRYKYVAYTRDEWQKVEAVLEAASEELAEEALWEAGYLVATVKPVGRVPSLAGLMLSSFRLKAWRVMLLVLATLLGLYLLMSYGPLMPIVGRSMEPTLRLFDLILIEKVLPQEVSEGDIIVFNVSSTFQEAYNYPPVVAHRVIEVGASGGAPTFRTKGDNTGEEPFTVFPRDLTGRLHKSIPYLGFLPLFLRSRQALYFIVTATVLFGLYHYSEEINGAAKRLHRRLFGPLIEDQTRSSQELQQKVGGVEQALGELASAMSEYTSHISTSAPQR